MRASWRLSLVVLLFSFLFLFQPPLTPCLPRWTAAASWGWSPTLPERVSPARK